MNHMQQHLEHLEAVFTRLKDAGLKVNLTKSKLCRTELEYLGYWITRQGIQPLTKKVEAILAIAQPKTKKQLRSFIGMVNFYRDVWPKRSELLAPLSSMTSKTAKFQWTEQHDKSVREMKRKMARETLLAFPDFSKPFDIHTDASKVQIGAIISQEGR